LKLLLVEYESNPRMSITAKHVAIISGGAGDIGRAIARELARHGADIAVGDLIDRGPKVDSLRSAVEMLGRQIRFDVVDVTDAAAVDNWCGLVEDLWECRIGLFPTRPSPHALILSILRPMCGSTVAMSHSTAHTISRRLAPRLCCGTKYRDALSLSAAGLRMPLTRTFPLIA
jgi:NAD(P)-dependent dehydrogenase (short-subunit alcohol dehydrogenase family)